MLPKIKGKEEKTKMYKLPTVTKQEKEKGLMRWNQGSAGSCKKQKFERISVRSCSHLPETTSGKYTKSLQFSLKYW